MSASNDVEFWYTQKLVNFELGDWCTLYSLYKCPFLCLFRMEKLIIGFVAFCMEHSPAAADETSIQEANERKICVVEPHLLSSIRRLKSDNRGTFQSFTFSMNFYELRTNYLAAYFVFELGRLSCEWYECAMDGQRRTF